VSSIACQLRNPLPRETAQRGLERDRNRPIAGYVSVAAVGDVLRLSGALDFASAEIVARLLSLLGWQARPGNEKLA
jgi:hypothetical protein